MWPQDNAWGTVTQSRAIAQAVPGGRRNVPTALQLIQTRPVLATQAYTFKSSGSRTRSGPATSPPSTDSGGLAKPRSLARWYRGGETNALNGDPGAWLRSHRRSGAEDPLPARSEAPRMEELGEMLVDPSDQPPHITPAAPVHLPKYCRSNLQLEQACPDLRNTGIVAASDAGLWSSAPCSLAESQPL